MDPSSRVSGLMGEWVCLQEGEIAHDLIKRKLMKKTSCLEMGEEMLYITYQVSSCFCNDI